MENDTASRSQSLKSRDNSLTQQTYTPLYKADAIAPESPFSRSSSMTAMRSFLSQRSGSHSAFGRRTSGQLSTSLSVPNFQDGEPLSTSPDSSMPHPRRAPGSLQDVQRKDVHFPNRYSGNEALSTSDSSEMPQTSATRVAPGSPGGSGSGQPLRLRMRSNKERRRSQVEGFDDLQAVLSYNIALQTRATQLEKNLLAKDREIAALTRELHSMSSSGNASAAANVAAAADCAVLQPLAAMAGGEDFVQLGLDSQAQRLKQLVTVHDLNNADPTGEGLSGAVLGELKIVVKECLQIAEASFTPPQSAMVLPHIALEHRAVLPRRQAGWQRTLQAVKLSDKQVVEIMEWRSSTMARMQEAQQERQIIFSEMMGLLIPGGLLLHNNSAQDFCYKLSQEGWLPLAKVNSEADAAIKKLAACLERERKVFVQANAVLLSNILSPVQACIFMLHAWPAHCDCFGFANLLASKSEAMLQGIRNQLPTARSGSPMCEHMTEE